MKLSYSQLLAVKLTSQYGVAVTDKNTTMEVMDLLIAEIKTNKITIDDSNFILTLILDQV